QLAIVLDDGKRTVKVINCYICSAHLSLRREAISNSTALYVRYDAANIRVIQAERNDPVKGDFIGKFDKCLLYIFQVYIDIQMLGFNISDHSQRGAQPQERAVKLIRLHNNNISFSNHSIGF